MTPVHAIMVLIIRLWAADAVISSIISASYYVLFDEGKLSSISNEYLIASGFWVLIGFGAWVLAPWLARRLGQATPNAGLNININADQLVAIGSFLIGAFYLAKYGPQLLIDLGWWFVHLAGQDPVEEGQLGTLRRYTIEWRSTISNLLIITVASFMALRPAYLAKIFSWLRSVGHYDHSHDKLEKTSRNSP
ncbi:hypothetical protein MNBD_ALPHA05-1623 [hydrothermal vent metagenome]|uniref:Uncharacterized protein n=1 Tax=hydrothermal vent metagenome TaxID=652676 RepID=A0A3B0SX24_9ZZZZ